MDELEQLGFQVILLHALERLTGGEVPARLYEFDPEVARFAETVAGQLTQRTAATVLYRRPDANGRDCWWLDWRK